MAFKDFPDQPPGVALLQRSLERGRLAHAYLFAGDQLDYLERLAQALAKTLNCFHPVRKGKAKIDSCDTCLACQKIQHGNHTDVHWVRPESKTRIIRVEQIRELAHEINLKPHEADYKIAIIVAADRLKTETANAFLKTLEEPPLKSVLILLTTEPQRILETITSRCLRLNFAGRGNLLVDSAQFEWLRAFSQAAAKDHKSLLGRYRLMDVLVKKLAALRTGTEEALTERSPLRHYKDAGKDLIEKWEDELAAAIEAEYRRQRAELLGLLHWWLRDVWLGTLLQGASPSSSGSLLRFPELEETAKVAQRISPREAMDNLRVLDQLQRWLASNVQEALALEVGLLKLRL